jgi:hypothetical protein
LVAETRLFGAIGAVLKQERCGVGVAAEEADELLAAIATEANDASTEGRGAHMYKNSVG